MTKRKESIKNNFELEPELEPEPERILNVFGKTLWFYIKPKNVTQKPRHSILIIIDLQLFSSSK